MSGTSCGVGSAPPSRGSSPTIYKHDFEGLAQVLAVSDFDVYFLDAPTGEERVLEAFRSYALAKFLNLQSPSPGTLNYKYQWMDADSVVGQQDHRPQVMIRLPP